MITKEEIYQKIKEQLSLEFNCAPEDFEKTENTISSAVLHEKRRKFSEKPFFLQMATFGRGTVISADESIHPWLTKWVDGKTGFWLFEQHNFYDLEQELRKHGYKMSLTHHMFLPKPELLNGKPELMKPELLNGKPEPLTCRSEQQDCKPDFKIRILEQQELMEFYGREEFSNALCDHFRPDRPDMLAVVALDGEKIMGMAGCSADTPEFWQIGIDVLPEYRGKGIARTLVSLIRDETFRRGAIPYYGTSLSNLASWKTALASGFEPAWVETESRENSFDTFAK